MKKMLDKKQIQAIFLFKFKMGCKAEQITHNINKTFGPGTAKEHIVQLWFRKFFKEDKSLEDEDSGRPSGVDNDQLRAIIEANSLTASEVAKELNINHSMVIWHLKQIGKVKELDEWVTHELTTNQKKKITVWSAVLLLYATTNHFLIGLWHARKSGFYMKTTRSSSALGPRRSYKALPKKGHGHCFVVCCWSDPPQLFESW